MASPDHYEVLGISPDASPADIKAAFRKLAKKLHPDKQEGEGAAEQFRRLNEAYQVLSDPERREHFDWLRGQAKRKQPKPKPAHEPATAGPGEGARRRKYRHEVARKVRAHGRENVAENAEWLEELEGEELSLSRRAQKSQATLWIAAVLLLVIAALLAFAR